MNLVLSLLLFVAAGVGHVCWMVLTLNWFYGQPYPRRLLTSIKLLLAVLAALGPVGFWLLFGFDLVHSWTLQPEAGWRLVPALYTLLCWIMAFAVLPAATFWKWLGRSPAALLSNHTETVDVARQLGYRPAGAGKYRPLALLPGNQVFQVDFAERTYAMPGLPAAWDGLTILHLSDLHFNGSPDRIFFQKVMDLCRQQEPDLVAITGDIVDSHTHHRWVVPVLGRLRWKVAAFAILGNHDLWHSPGLVRRRLKRLKIRVIGNTWEQLDVRGEPLVVVGHEGPWFRPGPDLQDCPPDPFRLCLSHTPDNLAWGRRNHVRLMLAGHNHGGQIRLPLLGAIFVPSKYSRRYDCGSFHEPPTLLHVSRGLAGQQPLRYLCRPEVTRIVLKAP